MSIGKDEMDDLAKLEVIEWDYNTYEDPKHPDASYWTADLGILELMVQSEYDDEVGVTYELCEWSFDVMNHDESFVSRDLRKVRYRTLAEAQRACVEAARDVLRKTLKMCDRVCVEYSPA